MAELGPDEHYFTKIRRQGSGLHIYFPLELIKHPKFPFKEKDAILVQMDHKKKHLLIKKIDWQCLTGETATNEE